MNDSRTECSCSHLTHFAVLMQFDTDSELKTGQYSRLQKVGHKTERTEVSLLGLERRVLNAHPKLFHRYFEYHFFPNSHPWPISAYLTSRLAITFRVPSTFSQIPHCILFRSCFPEIPFQTLRKGWPHHRGLYLPLLSYHPLPVKSRILSTFSRILHCILLRSRIPAVSF